MQRFYWSAEEYESDRVYEDTLRELARHTWTVYTRGGVVVLQTSGTPVTIEPTDAPLYTTDRASAAARFRAWRRAGLRIERGYP